MDDTGMSTARGKLLAWWPVLKQITSVGGTHAIFVVRGRPEDYNLPSTPEVPTEYLAAGWGAAAVAAGMMLAGTFAAFLTSSRRRIPAD
jgi:hypothetical protein